MQVEINARMLKEISFLRNIDSNLSGTKKI